MTDKLNPNYGDGAQGGMYDKDPGKNRKWSKPQTYVGAYSQDKAVGPIVDQGFRQYLPPASSAGDDTLLDGQMADNKPLKGKVW